MTRLTRHIRAPREAVYRALVDADAVRRWMVPDNMTSQIHEFQAHEGGKFRISLTYDDPARRGKTAANTDTFHGRFVKLVPTEEVVQVVEFESDDLSMAGEVTISYVLTGVGGGTEVLTTHENLPSGIHPSANELGTRMSLDKLAKLVEAETIKPDSAGQLRGIVE
ncbi:MAG TPA: SRPBCC domain-containing protein [Acidimicrobiia bacterium]|nr:SRPBCC domain-containing protein [Acidimicrobiia bacterium]